MNALNAILRARDLVAVLGREVPVRLVDISVSGCLLESAATFVAGSTGALTLMVDGVSYTDDIRIMRCRWVDGASGMYHIGAEFLWTTPPRERSLRRVLPKLGPGLIKDARFEALRRM